MREQPPLTQAECQDPLVIRERFVDIMDRYFLGDNPYALTGAMEKLQYEVLKPLLKYVESVEQESVSRRRALDSVAEALLKKKGDGWTYVPGALAAEILEMRQERDALRAAGDAMAEVLIAAAVQRGKLIGEHAVVTCKDAAQAWMEARKR